MLLKKKDLEKALEILATHGKVLVPSEENEVSKFVVWEKGMDVDLTKDNTLLPTKGYSFSKHRKNVQL